MELVALAPPPAPGGTKRPRRHPCCSDDEAKRKSGTSARPETISRRGSRPPSCPPRRGSAALAELERLGKTDPSAAEYAVGLNYIEFMLGLPWAKATRDNLDPERAAGLLDARHYGLSKVKERVAEYWP